MKLSKFGLKFTAKTGILELMEDLGHAMAAGGDICMLGGGNPAPIPAVQTVIRQRMQSLLAEGAEFDRMIGHYDPPKGNIRFTDALVGLLNAQFGWDIGPENVAITNGSQSAFFFLFNMLAGEFADGTRRRILLPIIPEYIGYLDQGMTKDLFAARRPEIEAIGDHAFKYHVDFDNLGIDDDVAAICVSRPTNPSGNVLPDSEIRHLAALASDRGIPLMCDNAYGAPFPEIIFADVQPYWDANTIFSLSLSKIGLPATRTGIVVAAPEVIKALASVNAIVSLASGGIGAGLMRSMVESGEILQLSRDVIRPFYEARARRAEAWVHEHFDGVVDYRLHVCEGSMFLWLWFPSLKGTSHQLYQRLKTRRVIVVPGEYFFPGDDLDTPWEHRHQCIRVNYSHDPATVEKGIRIIAEEAASGS